MSRAVALISAVDVGYAIGATKLVERISLNLYPGKLVGLIGANGAGKSTLLRMLIGELSPTSGSVRLAGNLVQEMHASELSRRRAVVPQASSLAFPFTVLEVVCLGASGQGLQGVKRQIRLFATNALARVSLPTFANRLFTELSGGERQRVHVARALCQLEAARAAGIGSTALLLDEPTSNLDLAHQRIVLMAMREQAANDTAVLAVLHDLNLASAYCDEVLVMKDGHLIASGAPGDVMRNDVLTSAYGCDLFTNTPAPEGVPFVLPVTSRNQHQAR